ncbi:MAG: acetyl-CoA carboxylase biotin carboxyl carrier protein, partial [Gammaproteobacteria bacterium]
MDIRKVKKLIELLEESGIAEIEITEGEESVRISRYNVPPAQQMMMAQAPMPMAHAAAAAGAAPAAPALPTGHQVKSPMVGTFYRSPSPGAKA